ncbi:hypothetical protein CLJ1_4088 [Pseudomonas paraeruginosa]|nr:hypothetical protein CLJ1_4088 [Pseudomonas aeruginosa]
MQRHGLGFRSGELLFRPPGETLRSAGSERALASPRALDGVPWWRRGGRAAQRWSDASRGFFARRTERPALDRGHGRHVTSLPERSAPGPRPRQALPGSRGYRRNAAHALPWLPRRGGACRAGRPDPLE